jgi:transposase
VRTLSPRKGGAYSAGTNTALSTGIQTRGRLELYRSSERSIPKVAQELGITDESLRRWVRQHEVDQGEREGLSTEERQELSRLRKEVRVLKQEREFLKKARQALATSSSRRKRGLGELLQAHRGGEDELFYPAYVQDAGFFQEWLLRLAWQAAFQEEPRGHRPQRQDPTDPPQQQADLRLPADPRRVASAGDPLLSQLGSR